MIRIGKSATADTRTCDFRNVTRSTARTEAPRDATMFDAAVRLAAMEHDGFCDRRGLPVLRHVLRVVDAAPDGDAKIVAALHDIVEDTRVTLADLAVQFPPHIVQAVDAITRRGGEVYANYIARLSTNELARTVKVADLRDNIARGGAPSLRDRYRRALAQLGATDSLAGDSVLAVDPFSVVSPNAVCTSLAPLSREAGMSAPRKVRQLAMQHPVAVREDWKTPPKFFAPLNVEFRFTLDVCATPENAQCARYFTPDDDGLAQDWGRNVCWMNPPYGAEIPKWMAKAYAASQRGATVVCLVPARTDTRWWHDYAELADIRRFVRGRIRFVGARFNAPFPSAVVVFLPQSQERAA